MDLIAVILICIGFTVLAVMLILCYKKRVCCEDSETGINNVPTQHYSQDGFHRLPTSMPLPPSEYRNRISRSAPYPPEPSPYPPQVSPYPPEPPPLASGYPREMPQPYRDESPSILRMPQPYRDESPSHFRMPLPSDYLPQPVTAGAPYPPEVNSRLTPPFHRPRSSSAEDLPPSYAEAVRLEQRHHTSDTHVRDHA